MKVYLIDDETLSLKILSEMLKLEGIESEYCSNVAEDLISNLIEYDPDLILLDLYMPEKDGLKVFKDIKSHEELFNIPILALSSSVDIKDKAKVFGTGFDGFLSKTLDRQKMMACIRVQAKIYNVLKSLASTNEKLKEITNDGNYS